MKHLLGLVWVSEWTNVENPAWLARVLLSGACGSFLQGLTLKTACYSTNLPYPFLGFKVGRRFGLDTET